MIIIDTFLNSISWINTNAVGFLSLLLAVFIAHKSMGYFEKRQTEMTLSLVEDAYINLIKAIDVLLPILESPGWNRIKFEELKKDTVQFCSYMTIKSEQTLAILDKNKELFSDLANSYVKIKLFLEDPKYYRPIKDVCFVSEQIFSLSEGILSMCENIETTELDEKSAKELIEFIDLFAVQIWEEIEPSLGQIAMAKITKKPEEFRCFKQKLENSQKQSEVYCIWLKGKLRKYQNRKI